MQITNIGDTFQYAYDCKTQKLISSGDSKSDILAKWVNQEITQEDLPSEFNHYDGQIKNDLQCLFDLWSQDNNGFMSKQIQDAYENGDVLQLEVDVDSSYRNIIRVNGEDCLISEAAFDMLMDDIGENAIPDVVMIRSEHKDYDIDRNEIGIAVDESVAAGRGRTFHFSVNGIELMGNEDENDAFHDYFERMKRGLERLFYARKGDWVEGDIQKLGLEEAFEFLQNLGVDTARTFRLNGTCYEIRNTQVKEEQYQGAKINRNIYYVSLEAMKLWNLQNVSSKEYINRGQLL